MKKFFLSVLAVLTLSTAFFAQNFNVQFRSQLTYPGQTLANICGYWQDGREYALVGASKGLVVVDITNPDSPVNLIQIPGPDNLWKEIKTYGHYAYVTSEGGGGVQIVDLSNLPNTNLAYHHYVGDGVIDSMLNSIHALHIDVTKGFLYAYGHNLFNQGALVLDLNADPYNPVYAGHFDQLGYIHDGYADNDTLYASHIYTGLVSIVDMKDKLNPLVLGTVQTPGKFTHNTWLLDNHKVMLTTDETTPSFLTAYDISDPTDIQELDRFSTNDGYGSYVHNTHVLNDWAVTSWYTDGFTIVDAHRPQNLVMTGWFDTYNGTGAQFSGCWGVFPFFPSGTIVTSDISPGVMNIITPNYVRACYLEGTVLNGCDGLPLADVEITVSSNAPQVNTRTQADGTFRTGQATPGLFSVTASKPGYISQTLELDFIPGAVTGFNISLQPVSANTVSGLVVDGLTLSPIANAPVILNGPGGAVQVITDNAGAFVLNCALDGEYLANAGAWGYLPSQPFAVSGSGNVTIALYPGYYDDFGLDLGWTNTSNAQSGDWVLDIPVGTSLQGQASNPFTDIDLDFNDHCYVTANGNGSASADDVDNGTVTLTSPLMQLGIYESGILSFWYWFFNAGGNGSANDTLIVKASNGTQTATLFTELASASEWRFAGPIDLKDFLPLTNSMRISFITSDLPGSGNIVEAGIDMFQLVPSGISGTAVPEAKAAIQIWPNPSSTGFNLRYDWPGAATDIRLSVTNLLGQEVFSEVLDGNTGLCKIPRLRESGIFLVRIAGPGGMSRVAKIVQE